MDWVWRRLAHYMRAKTVVEFSGITTEELQVVLCQESLRRLKWAEEIVFTEELNSEEKVETLQAWFLEQSPMED